MLIFVDYCLLRACCVLCNDVVCMQCNAIVLFSIQCYCVVLSTHCAMQGICVLHSTHACKVVQIAFEP